MTDLVTTKQGWQDVRVSLGADAEVSGKLSFATATRIEGDCYGRYGAGCGSGNAYFRENGSHDHCVRKGGHDQGDEDRDPEELPGHDLSRREARVREESSK